jgi:hypothetical protein
MAKAKRIDLSAEWDNSGITIEYVKSRDVFYISGWYDTFVGIEGAEMTRAEFEKQLGIPANPPKAGPPSDGGES